MSAELGTEGCFAP